MRYFVVGSDGRPNEVSLADYERYIKEPYFTTYKVGGCDIEITSLTEETEDAAFPK